MRWLLFLMLTGCAITTVDVGYDADMRMQMCHATRLTLGVDTVDSAYSVCGGVATVGASAAQEVVKPAAQTLTDILKLKAKK